MTVEHVETALDRIAEGAHGRRPLSRSTLGRVRDVAVDVVDFAVRRRIVATNVARLAELTPSALTADTVADTAARGLDDEGLRSAATRLAAELSAMPAASDAVPRIEQLVHVS